VRLQHPASHPYCSGAVAPPLLQLVRGHLPPLLPASRYTPTPGLMNMPAVLAALLSHMPRLQQLLLLPPDRAAVAPWEESWPLQLSYVPVFKPQGLAPALMVPCWPEQGGWWGQAQVRVQGKAGRGSWGGPGGSLDAVCCAVSCSVHGKGSSHGDMGG
jgi:hypothetical protein